MALELEGQAGEGVNHNLPRELPWSAPPVVATSAKEKKGDCSCR